GLRHVVRFGVQIRGLHERFALHLAVLLRVAGDALELRGRLAAAPRFGVRDGELVTNLGLQLVLRIVAAEGFEHVDRAIPLFQGEELRRGVILGRRADLRVGRHAGNTQEILHRAGAVAALLLRLALLVDGRRKALGEIVAHLRVAVADELTRLQEGRLRLVVRALVVVRLRDDVPGDALLLRIHRRLPREDHLRYRNRARQILRGEDFLGRARQHAGA